MTLPVSLQDTASFENYLPNSNEAALDAVQSLLTTTATGASIFLWGQAGTGKSHLLIAACRLLQERGGRARYVPLAHTDVEHLDELHNRGMDLIAVDDVQAIKSDAAAQRALMQIYEQRHRYTYNLIFAATHQPAQLGLGLPDLVTRLGAGGVFALRTLSDDAKVDAIRLRADRRGLRMDTDVIAYALARLPRDNATLFNFLDAIDNQSLAAHRRITKVLVRELLASQ